MLTQVVTDIADEAFSTCSELSGKQLSIHLKGCLDMDTEPALRRFLEPIAPAIKAGLVREVVFYTADLLLMTSSSISRFASWLKLLKQLKPHCYVRFKTNPNLAWQRRTLETIRKVSEQLTSVE